MEADKPFTGNFKNDSRPLEFFTNAPQHKNADFVSTVPSENNFTNEV